MVEHYSIHYSLKNVIALWGNWLIKFHVWLSFWGFLSTMCNLFAMYTLTLYVIYTVEEVIASRIYKEEYEKS